ncbi:MAG: hypothetical protein WBA25_15790 [Jannaschia sp.]
MRLTTHPVGYIPLRADPALLLIGGLIVLLIGLTPLRLETDPAPIPEEAHDMGCVLAEAPCQSYQL